MKMIEDGEKEVVIGQAIYVFASAGLARAFSDCLRTGTVNSCKLDYPPVAIYPPAIDHLKQSKSSL